MIKLRTKYWGYPETYHGQYISFYNHLGELRESGWYETHDPHELNLLREEAKQIATDLGVEVDVTSSDTDDWQVLN